MRRRITVVGDVMIDVDNIVADSNDREDRPRLVMKESNRRLGAAGAVAQMVAALGFDVTLVTVAALDDVLWIRRQLQGFAYIVGHDSVTTRRERFYWPNWKIAGPRLDFNSQVEISEADHLVLSGKVLASWAEAIIVCDHAQGVVGSRLMESLKTSIPVFVDPHSSSDFVNFAGIECLVMNREEALAATYAEPAPKNIISKMDADGLFWYRDGWLMAEEKPGEFDSHRLHFPSMAGEIVDTLGAGDQFVAALTCARVIGNDWETAIMKANAAAGIQCERRGIKPVTWREIDARLEPKP